MRVTGRPPGASAFPINNTSHAGLRGAKSTSYTGELKPGSPVKVSAMMSGNCSSHNLTFSPALGITNVPLITTTNNSRPLGSRPKL